MFFLHFFVQNYQSKVQQAKELDVSTNMTSGTGPNHIQILLFPYHHVYTSIQTQRNIASDASVGENYVSSSGLYQSTNHHGNTDFNNNDDSQSFETPR